MSLHETINLRVERGVGDIINVTFGFLRQNLIPLGKSLLFIVGPVALISGFQGLDFFDELRSDAEAAEVTGSDPSTVFFESLARNAEGSNFLFILINALATILALTIVHGFIKLYEEKGAGNIEVDDVWEMIKEKFWPMFSTLMFSGVLYFASILIIALPAGLGLLGPSTAMMALSGILIVISSLVWVCVFLYLLVVLSMLFPIRMNEPIGIIEGFQRSRYLVRNNIGRCFGVLIFSGLLMSVLVSFFYIPVLLMTFLGVFHGVTEETDSWMKYVFTLATMIANTGGSVLYAIPLVAVSMQYFNLVERKEKAGLMGRIDEIRTAGDETF